MRKNRVPRPPVQTRPGGPLMRTIKLDPPELNTPSCPDASRPQVISSHPVVSPGMSNLPPTSESLLASVDRMDEVNSTRMLAPGYSLSYSVEPRSPGYTSDALPALATGSSSRSSDSFPGNERALRQNTRTWRYSRDPLHNRYPDFSKFFLPVPSDTIGDTTKMPEFSPIAMSPLTHNPSSIDTALFPDFAVFYHADTSIHCDACIFFHKIILIEQRCARFAIPLLLRLHPRYVP
ncbi:hypothetical protein DFJ58DRAFT_436732 [Suillus subalutaceus]|uniref:uncharacterized protein n=1 Tax=Suillus subalutaceus TaxID=48586 RepID=UPI001B8657CD|nr:uncharacterized protein DFJ58DRAFT_436732 [Suillus subalutaceus]KAG1872375.1 hypothetical protein DFJ58DRAFT_436732 [Suillus subalutaceus]